MAKKFHHEQFERAKSLFPSAKAEDFAGRVLPPDIEEVKQWLIREYLEEHKLEVPGYVLKTLFQAAEAEGSRRAELCESAKHKAQTHYLSAWARGEIKQKDESAPPMPEDVKELLKVKNAERREREKAEREADKKRKEHFAKVETEKAAKAAPKPTAKLPENKQKKTVAKKSKKPVFDDPDTQQLVLAKYPWAIPGTFRQDPDKPAGTNLDIKCQKCGMARTIHLADAFQVKFCTSCKNGTNGKQSTAATGVGK